MVLNKLMNNADKLKALLVGTNQQLSKIQFDSITIADVEVKISDQIRNLGVIFHKELNIASQVDSLCRTAFLQIRDLRDIWKNLDKEATKTALHTFVSSHRDYGNALLYRALDKQIKHVQCVQNVAAKLVTGGRKYDHVTHILRELHWLPIRLKYKCTLLAWKTVNG